MSADKVSEAVARIHSVRTVRKFMFVREIDALIAAVREDEKARCIAAVMKKRPDVAYDRDDDHINEGLSLALEAIRNA